MNRLEVEPGQEDGPDGLHRRDRVRVQDVEHSEVLEADLVPQLDNRQRVARRLDLGDDGDAPLRAACLHHVEVCAGIRLVAALVEACDGRVVGPQPKTLSNPAYRLMARSRGYLSG